MIEDQSVLAVIPARGGSKGVPRKNIRMIGGKPLIAWSIREAKKSRWIDRMILSSEDPEIIEAARGLGCEVPFVRSMSLAGDEATTSEVIADALEHLPGYDYTVLIQPTSPLVAVEDIDGCIEKCRTKGATSCVTVSEPFSSPFWMYTMDEEDSLAPILDGEYLTKRRQEFPLLYEVNGAVYVAETGFFLKNGNFLSPEMIGYVMPQERSFEIDTELDMTVAEALLARRTAVNPLPWERGINKTARGETR